MKEISEIIEEKTRQTGKGREALIPVLQAIVEEKRFLTEDSMLKVAEHFDLSAADVYGTASFYSFLDLKPRGKYIIRLCKTIACDMKGKGEILEAIQKVLKIKEGETTPDKKFTLLTTNCIGWCHKGPAMLVNDDVFTELTPQKAVEIINEYMQK